MWRFRTEFRGPGVANVNHVLSYVAFPPRPRDAEPMDFQQETGTCDPWLVLGSLAALGGAAVGPGAVGTAAQVSEQRYDGAAKRNGQQPLAGNYRKSRFQLMP